MSSKTVKKKKKVESFLVYSRNAIVIVRRVVIFSILWNSSIDLFQVQPTESYFTTRSMIVRVSCASILLFLASENSRLLNLGLLPNSNLLTGGIVNLRPTDHTSGQLICGACLGHKPVTLQFHSSHGLLQLLTQEAHKST